MKSRATEKYVRGIQRPSWYKYGQSSVVTGTGEDEAKATRFRATSSASRGSAASAFSTWLEEEITKQVAGRKAVKLVRNISGGFPKVWVSSARSRSPIHGRLTCTFKYGTPSEAT